MIAPPLNDHACLAPTTDLIVAEIAAQNPSIVDLAGRFSTTDDLAAWFRTLPQRDDVGAISDGPKVGACRPPQRLDFDNPEPNCFERAAKFCAAAELIEPDREYRLATVSTPNGLHTFPMRDGAPVILDPPGTRNTPGSSDDRAVRRLRIQRLIGLDDRKGLRFDLANARRAKELGHTTWLDGRPIDQAIASYETALERFRATLAELDAEEATSTVRNTSLLPAPTEAVTMTPAQAIDWIVELAMERAEYVAGGVRRIENGHRAMRGVLVLRPIAAEDVRDVALVLALAERAARTYGLVGLKIVHSAAIAIDALDQVATTRAVAPPRNFPWVVALSALANNKELQSLLGPLTRVGGRIAVDAGLEALKLKLNSAGIAPPVITAFEKELNREGLTLGALAKPAAMVGSLDAMTPQALAGRWIAQKL